MTKEVEISKILWINTILFLGSWTTFFLSGADHPPPIGFLWVVLFIVVLDTIQYVYLRGFLRQLIDRKKRLFTKNLLFFVTGGILVAVFVSILQIIESKAISTAYVLFWIGLMVIVGILYARLFWFFNIVLLKVFKIRV
ncbi:hypothetical protein [Neobacillus niacini]|uniref:hypothetical protein n=1 Tax=Neobacillus niacini TaxID=86668 RepID=UPI0005F02864|nr:hypothetical protein [Neobacillus niacini]